MLQSMSDISAEGIAAAHKVIDPAFVDSPQFLSDPLSEKLGMRVVLKVETLNPIRSFKGRGTDYLLHRLGPHERGYVCASAGNFGQGLAYAARKRNRPVTVFAAVDANPLKIERMRALGAEVILEGEDFEGAKAAARRRAGESGAMFLEDGALPPIAEGAGTIALELTRMSEGLDAVMVPLGDGALITGVGAWMREKSPRTAVVGVVADGAPAMDLSWRAHRVIATETTSTIADGIAVRTPIAEAVGDMDGLVDNIVRVSDAEIIEAMRMLMTDAGLLVEPAGAVGLAAVANMRGGRSGERVAVIVTGGNITPEQIRRWLLLP
jgi:threonine dehydratase